MVGVEDRGGGRDHIPQEFGNYGKECNSYSTGKMSPYDFKQVFGTVKFRFYKDIV